MKTHRDGRARSARWEVGRFLMGCALSMTTGLSAQPCQINASASWAASPTSAAIVGDALVVGAGRDLLVLDVETLDLRSTVELVPASVPVQPLELEASGTSVYALHGGTLFEVDASEPEEPAVLRQRELMAESAHDLVVLDGHLWVALDPGGLMAVDLETLEPSESCCELFEFSTLSSWQGRLLGLDGDFFYVLDASEPDSPEVGASVPVESGGGIAVLPSEIVVSEVRDGLARIMISEDGVPSVVGRIPLEDGARRLASIESQLLVVTSSSVRSVDFSTPVPTVRPAASIARSVSDLVVAGETAFMIGSRDGVTQIGSVWDTPVVGAEVSAIGGITSLAVEGDMLFFGTGAGAWVQNRFADRQQPLVAYLSSPGWVRLGPAGSSSFRNGIGYIAGGDAGLQIVDLLAMPAPVRLWSDESFIPTRTVLEGDLLFVHTRFNDIQMFDVSDASQPVPYGQMPARAITPAMVASGHLFAYSVNGGVQLVDVSDPDGPVDLGVVELEGVMNKPGDLAIESGYLFAIANYQGVFAIDLGADGGPSVVSQFADGFQAGQAMTLYDGFVLVAGQAEDVVHIIDFRDIETPVRVGESIGVPASDLQIVGNELFVVTGPSVQVSRLPRCIRCLCDEDLNGEVGIVDLLEYVGLWLEDDPDADLDADMSVSIIDLLLFVECWLDGDC